MWLGFSAAFIGMFYALVKFLTVYQLRQLNNRFVTVQYALQKTQQRAAKLDEKLHIEQSKKRTIEREITGLNKGNDQLYARLQATLPNGVLSQLDRCRALRAENTIREYKMLHALQLMDRVSQVLEPMSLLLVRFPQSEEGDQAVAVAGFIEVLEEGGMGYHGPEGGELVSYTERP